MEKTKLKKLKQELQASLESLERINKVNKRLDQEQIDAAEAEIKAAKVKLNEIDCRPVLVSQDVDAINKVIIHAFEEFDFEDPDNYDFNYYLDYDNTIQVNSMQTNKVEDAVYQISNAILELFKIEEHGENEE